MTRINIFSFLTLYGATFAATQPLQESQNSTDLNGPSDFCPSYPSTPSSNPSNITTDPTADPSVWKIIRCYDNSPTFINRWNCADAVFRFPPAHNIGTFHQGDPVNAYQLPTFRDTADCRIRIEMIDETATEEATWSDLQRDMCSIIHTCSQNVPRGWMTQGGWTSHGTGHGIKISVGRAWRNDAGIGGGDLVETL